MGIATGDVINNERERGTCSAFKSILTFVVPNLSLLKVRNEEEEGDIDRENVFMSKK